METSKRPLTGEISQQGDPKKIVIAPASGQEETDDEKMAPPSSEIAEAAKKTFASDASLTDASLSPTESISTTELGDTSSASPLLPRTIDSTAAATAAAAAAIAAYAESGGDAETAAIASQLDITSVLNLSTGDSLEVKWDMTDLETGKVREVWWGCLLKSTCGQHAIEDLGDDEDGHRVSPRGADTQDKAVLPVYEIDYDAMPPDYPERESARVCFTSDHTLYDVDQDATQVWRIAGSGWEEPEEGYDAGGERAHAASDEAERGAAACADGAARSAGHRTAADGSLIVTDAGTFVDSMLGGILEKMAGRLAELPRMQQGFIASVVRSAKDSLTQKMQEMLNRKRESHCGDPCTSEGEGGSGQPPVVTQQDVAQLLASVGAELEEIKRKAAAELAA